MRWGVLPLVWMISAMLCLAGAGAPALAQGFDDYRMFETRPAQPPADPARPPDLADYGRIAETFRGGQAVSMTERSVSHFRDRLAATLRQAPELWSDVKETLSDASPDGDPRFFLGLIAFLAFLIGIGRAAATLFAVYVARPIFVGMQRPNPVGIVDKLPVLATRVALMVVSTAIAIAVAALVGAGFYPEDNAPATKTAILVFSGYAVIRVVSTLWRMILCPFLPEYRLPSMDDRQARKLYHWLVGTAVFDVLCSFSLTWLEALGLTGSSLTLMQLGFALVLAIVVAAGATANRKGVSSALLGGVPAREATWPAAAAAALWFPVLLVYLVASWALLTLRLVMGDETGPPPLGVAFLVLLAALLAYAGTVFAVERFARARRRRREMAVATDAPPPPRDPLADGGAEMDSDDDEGGGVAPSPTRPAPVEHGVRGRMRTFEDLARRVASLFALGAAIWAMVYLWGGRAAFAPGTPLDRAQGVIDILLIGYVVYHAVRIWIDQRIAAEGGPAVMGEPGDEGSAFSAASRLATLLPLVRNFLLILILASVTIFVAMEIGINVAPLLGGAGVIGLAIGFGSQALIRDILSGVFFLVDDAFRKGEYIDIGGVKGTVEQISIRSFQLRHHLGPLHTVPFGEIKHLTNFSRDWVIMKLPLRLTYDTDPDKVRKLIKRLGEELLQHPEEGRKFLQPLKSQGVYMMEDSAMIIRVKYMTRPGDQWTTRKLVYQEIRRLFEQEGIKFAHREVTVRIPELEGDKERGLSAGEMKAIGAAARRAVDDADEAALVRPRAVGDDR